MDIYKNSHKNSGITHFEIGKDYIDIKFKDKPDIYIYSYSVTGKPHVEQMKILAQKGEGLNTYINQHSFVKNNFKKRS